MARALWRGAISFGLIYLPVEVHTASRENTLPLHMLDSRDFSPIGYRHINKRTGEEVDWKHIVKGYEHRKGDYVVLTDADFKHANVKASETIQVETFCDAAAIPYIYYEKPYYLAPAKGGAKVYALLRQALKATGKVAVATFVMHQREHLCVVSPTESSLTLLTLRFPDEILPVETASRRGKGNFDRTLHGEAVDPADVGRFRAQSLQGHLSLRPRASSSGKDSQQGDARLGRGAPGGY